MRLLIDLQAAQTSCSMDGAGAYALALASEMLRQRGAHDIRILLSGAFPHTIEPLRSALDSLLPQDDIVVWESLGPLAASEPGNATRRRAAAVAGQAVVARWAPDLLLHGAWFQGWADDAITALAPPGLPTAVLLHGPGLHGGPAVPDREPEARRWHALERERLRRAAGVFTSSGWAADEVVGQLGLDRRDVHDIGGGVDARRDVPEADVLQRRLEALGLDRPFVLGSSARWPEPLIQAWSRLEPGLRSKHRLVLPAAEQGSPPSELMQFASSHGLAAGELVFIDEADEDVLLACRRRAQVVVVLGGGDGPPTAARQALACGRAVIAARVAALPEVLARDDVLFGALDPADLAARLAPVLSDAGLRAALERRALHRAGQFSWAESAKLLWARLGDLARTPAPAPRPLLNAARRLLFVPCGDSPSPGAAAAEAALVPELGRHYRVEILAPSPRDTSRWPGFVHRDWDWVLMHAAAYDRIVYAVAAGPGLGATLTLMAEWPGLAWLLDRSLERLFPLPEDAALRLQQREQVAAQGWSALQADAGAVPVPLGLGRLPGALGVLLPGATPEVRPAAEHGGDERVRRLPLPGPETHARACGEAMAAAIESLYGSRPVDAHTAAAAVADAAPGLTRQERETLARSLYGNLPPQPRRPQWLLDVSELAQRDSRSGIQRVVKALLLELVRQLPADIDLQPVRATAGQPGYRYAHGFMSRFLGQPWDWDHDGAVEAWPGDQFFALDFQPVGMLAQLDVLQRWHRRGVRVRFLVHDLLPVLRPDCFPAGASDTHQAWLRAVAGFDGAVCVSRAVADELLAWLDDFGPVRGRPFELHWSHNGADIDQAAPSRGLPADAERTLARLRQGPALLMVGTLEPRKGHAQALAAMETLWRQGEAARLVIVGRGGWQVEALCERLRDHPEAGRRLFWLEGVSDEYLASIYAASSGLLMASEGEGFGLPLMEAACHGLPLIARDLPVFREIAGDHASYFVNDRSAQTLADALARWLADFRAGRHITSQGLVPLKWRDSAARLIDILRGATPYRCWRPDPGRDPVSR